MAHPDINELQNSRRELFLSFESCNVQDPGAGWGRKWLLSWQCPSSCSSTGARSCHCPVLGVLGHAEHPRTFGVCCRAGVKGQDSVFHLCSCSVLATLFQFCFFFSLQVFHCVRFPFEGEPHNKTLFSQLLGHLYLVVPAPDTLPCCCLDNPCGSRGRG